MAFDITVTFFIYGLAFFCMGVVMAFESGRTPLLAAPKALRPLALFGLIHGSHEWLEMFLDTRDWILVQQPVLITWLRILLLLISFTQLIIFGWLILQPQRKFSFLQKLFWGFILGLYALVVVVLGVVAWSAHHDMLYHIDALVRYFFGMTGAMLAGIALHRRAAQARLQARTGLSRSLALAGGCFLLYSFTQGIVPPLDVFPANVVNTATFLTVTGIPIQVVRAVLAVGTTVGLFWATQLVEVERQEQLKATQAARLAAMEQVQQELVEREMMRQELLRHIVLAQEEGRIPIARELHDETAQILTGFTLHLAALENTSTGDSSLVEQVTHLKALSQKMSKSIYRLIRDLRPAQLDDLGLTPALQFLVDEEQKRGLEVQYKVQGEHQRLDPLVETVLFRVAQESLTNVMRHAGVSEASLELHFLPREVLLRVADQGVGFDQEAGSFPVRGWGLAGMRERAESVGGSVRIHSMPGEGTIVEVRVPYHSAIVKDKKGLKVIE